MSVVLWATIICEKVSLLAAKDLHGCLASETILPRSNSTS